MRVSDDRYSRDFRSFHLALWMLNLAARTSTVAAWTGISPRRVRNLSRSHRSAQATRELERHRGPPPTQLGKIMTNPVIRCEVAAMGGLCRILGVVPEQPMQNPRRRLPSLAKGERLCAAFELFRQVVPNARLSLEQAVLVVYALAEAERWALSHCQRCRAVIVLDRLSLHGPLCVHCQDDARSEPHYESLIGEGNPEESELAATMQPDLFGPDTETLSSGKCPQERVVERQQQPGADPEPQQSPERHR